MEGTRQSRKRPLPQDKERVFRKRVQRNLTQNQLAEKAQLSKQQMSAIESGSRGASPDALHRLADALDCDVTELMPREATGSVATS